MRKNFIALFVVSILVAADLPLLAQTLQTAPKTSSPANDVYFINRAKNLARQAAISANGGLGKYRPAPGMYGPAIQTDYLRNPDGSITFKFTGSVPGSTTPSVETIARVLPSGTVNLEYNGVPRLAADSGSSLQPSSAVVSVPIVVPSDPASITPSSTPTLPANSSVAGSIREVPAGTGGAAWVDQDAFVSRAQNLARQAAIKANGGLSAYRPESSMYGPSSKAPFVKNADGSLMFTFKGGMPGSSVMTVESVVIVNPNNSVNVQYNGAVR